MKISFSILSAAAAASLSLFPAIIVALPIARHLPSDVAAALVHRDNPSSATNTTNTTRSCNGDPSLCSKRYTEVTFIGAHNSYSNGTSISSDQSKSVTDQLNSGIRLLQNQGHYYYSLSTDDANPSKIHLCHTSCLLLDGGTVEAYLQQVKTWLDANPDEVLTILFTNPDGNSVQMWNQAVEYVTGLKEMAYVPPKKRMRRSDWPTLGEMIDSKKRVVFFMDANADQDQVDYILDEFSQMYENPYDQLNLPFNCTRDRGNSNDTLYLHNHTKDVVHLGVSVPDDAMLGVINSALGEYGIVDTVQRCQRESNGIKATFVLVDFYDNPAQRGVFDAARVLNGLPLLNDTSSQPQHNGTMSSGAAAFAGTVPSTSLITLSAMTLVVTAVMMTM